MTEVASIGVVPAGRLADCLEGVETSFAAAAQATGGSTEDRYTIAGRTMLPPFRESRAAGAPDPGVRPSHRALRCGGH